MSLLEVLKTYAERGASRFHMPGHKGVLPPPFNEAAKIDVTELGATGDLYHENNGAIRESERGMAALYGAKDCLYLTGGATQGIFAMLASAAAPGDSVYVWRGCHRSVHNALALLDLRPVWFWDAPPEGIRAPLIYTSPDYYGRLYPKPKTDGFVLCDAAHGAHLPFCLPDYSPPGNLWVTSAHKTLGALGQSAMLLSDGSVGAEVLREQSAVFGTASPSFVLLASLDAARAELTKNGSWARVTAFTRSLAEKDSRVFVQDPAKVTVTTGDGLGDAARLNRELSVVPEMADKYRLVFMLSPHNTDEDFSRLEQALAAIPVRDITAQTGTHFALPESVMTPREAFFSLRERVPLTDAAGRIAARVFAPSPPGVPLFSPGERIDKKTLDILPDICYNEDELIWVVKEDFL